MTTAQVVEPGHELCPIMSRDRSQVLLFITVPDGEKKLKNRLHLDLRPVDVTRDEEVERLLALGASQAGDFRRPDGRGWIALTDPEGRRRAARIGGPARPVHHPRPVHRPPDHRAEGLYYPSM
jgi:hypothetical protein